MDSRVICPVVQIEHKSVTDLDQSNHKQIKKTLMIGLFVGVISFAALQNGTGETSFSIIFSVVTGILAACLSAKYLKQEANNETARKACPVVGKNLKLRDYGFFGPSTIAWKTGADPSFLIVGIAAGLLQMMHPDVVRMIEKSGVFYKDPIGRGERTALHGRSILYGDKETAEAASKAFIKQHNALTATNPETGEKYSASRPDLLLWVHNSLIWTVLRTFRIYGPVLTSEEEDQYIKEQHISAKLLGLEGVKLPDNVKELNKYMDDMLDMLSKLKLTDDAIRFRDFLLKKGCPTSLTTVIETILLGASVRIMTPEQKKIFCIQTSRLSDFAIESLTKIMIKVLRYGFPAHKIIPKARDELAEHSFGQQFLKR